LLFFVGIERMFSNTCTPHRSSFRLKFTFPFCICSIFREKSTHYKHNLVPSGKNASDQSYNFFICSRFIPIDRSYHQSSFLSYSSRNFHERIPCLLSSFSSYSFIFSFGSKIYESRKKTLDTEFQPKNIPFFPT